MKQYLLPAYIAIIVLFGMQHAHATPTRFGDTGMITQPTADTHQSGSICIGLWADNSHIADGNDITLVPASITLGLGTFLEAYGSYPNLAFNDDETESRRGYANVGMKARIWGKRSSSFKLAFDAQARRFISNNPERDGLTDYLYRGVASLKMGKFSLHANGGQINKESPEGIQFEDRTTYGGGLEFMPSPRYRFMAEYSSVSELFAGEESEEEALFGIQYAFSPHLSFSLAGGVGMSDSSPDWRVITGFYACQGTGTYVKPITPPVEEPEEPEVVEEGPEPVQTLQIRAISPLIPGGVAPADPTDPVSKLQVPVKPGQEEVVVEPGDVLPLTASLTLPGAGASPVSPVSPVSPAVSLPGVPTAQLGPQGGGQTGGTATKPSSASPVRSISTKGEASGPTARARVEKSTSSPVSVVSKALKSAAATAAAGPQPAATVAPVSPVAPVALLALPKPAPGSPATKPETSGAAPVVAAESKPVEHVAPLSPVATIAPQASVTPRPAIEEPAVEKTAPTPGELATTPEQAAEPAQKVVAVPPVPPATIPPQPQGMTPDAQKELLSQPFVASVYQKYRFPEFSFGIDQTTLSDEGRKALALVAERIRKLNQWFVMRVDGHTDSTGSSTYNDKLSLKRAIVVASYLVNNEGFDPNRIFVKGFGENESLRPNDSQEGRSVNRRCELLILLPKGDG